MLWIAVSTELVAAVCVDRADEKLPVFLRSFMAQSVRPPTITLTATR
jgi:hypothetical protein